MDEEKRIITIYPDIDYDGSIDKLKEILAKFNATLKSANDDEYQIEIAKSKLEDLCNELDLDIDDMTEEWNSYVPVEDKSDESNEDLSSYVGKIDSCFDDFDVNSFLENARQNKTSVETRLQKKDKVYELYVDFEDGKAYIEFWLLDFKHDAEDMHCNTKLLYSADFDENDLSKWKESSSKLDAWFKKKVKEKTSKHIPHHELHESKQENESANDSAMSRYPGFSPDEAIALDRIEEATNESELTYAISCYDYLVREGIISDFVKPTFERAIRYKTHYLSKDACDSKVKDYEYDEKLAKEIRNEILEGANADVPQHIDYAISSRHGNVESMRIAPDSIHVLWNLNGFTGDNRIYLSSLDMGVNQLAEDIAHAIWKTNKAKDANEKKHVANIQPANMKEIAQICDLLDEGNVKYELTNDEIIIHCGPQQWKDLQARFSILRGE